jgi:hypothetical protein
LKAAVLNLGNRCSELIERFGREIPCEKKARWVRQRLGVWAGKAFLIAPFKRIPTGRAKTGVGEVAVAARGAKQGLNHRFRHRLLSGKYQDPK